MESSDSLPRIDKVSDDKFHAWKQKIILLLSLKDLQKIIAPEPIPTNIEVLETWKKQDGKAMVLIGVSLSDNHLGHVGGTTGTRDLWKYIMDVFERHTLLNKISARRKFYTATMATDESVLEFTNRVKHLAGILESMKVGIDDEKMAMTTLNGVPPCFHGLISALDALGTEERNLSFDFVKTVLSRLKIPWISGLHHRL